MTTEPRPHWVAVAMPRYDFIGSLLRQDFPPPADVVELGAAPGDQCVLLAQAGYRVTAVDIGLNSDQWAGAEAGRMKRLFDENRITSVEWNLEETPYPMPEAAFDAVVMTEVYEHLRNYPVRSLEEARRILRPGGRLYFTTPNAAYLMTRLKALSGRSPATSLSDWIAGVPHARHAREYTFAEVKTLMAHARLRPVYVTGREFYLGEGPKRFLKQGIAAIARVRPTLGPLIICVAER